MAVLMTPFFIQFEDANGDPISGGKVYTYAAGTDLPKATYTDSTEAFEAPNPVILDSAGRATIWISGSYKFVLTDANDVEIETTDNVSSFTASATAASVFQQELSGDGSETIFTLLEDMGTVSGNLFIFVDSGDGKGFEILYPTEYTIDGTTLTFATAPALGTNNIQVRAPLTLANQAAASAAAAESAQANAAASAMDAEDAKIAAEAAQLAAENAQVGAETAEGNAEAAQLSAENAQDLAEDWASKVDGIVDATDYSSKAYAIGGTGTETNNAKYYSEQALINSGFVWAGMWSAGTYTINQAVEHNGSSWIVTVASTTGEPGVSGDWDLLAEKGADGTGITDGNKGDITVSSSGLVWDINNGVVGTVNLGGDITAAGKALLDDADAAAQRTTLGLGTAAVEDVGTGIGDVVQLEDVGGNAALPAVDGSQLTGLAIGGGLIGIRYYTCPSQTVTINVATPAVFTGNAITLPEIGCEVRLTTTGTLPTPLATGTTYYVVAKPTATTLHLSTTKGGTPIATTVAGSGTHTILNAPYEKSVNNPSYVNVTVVGGGGLGGIPGSQGFAGGGGGGAKKTINNTDIGSSETITCGGSGGTSSFGSIVSATGGGTGGSGVGVGGDINIYGCPAAPSGSNTARGAGGASAFGLGKGSLNSTSTGVDAYTPGLVIVEEYS